MQSLTNLFKNPYKLFLFIAWCLCIDNKAFPAELKNNIPNSLKPDVYYMDELVKFAKANPKNFPFTAMIVNKETGKILCEGINQTDKNPLLHGEIVAIMQCANSYPNLNWSNTILYTTAEPCPMCESGIIWAHISKVVYGTSIDYLIKHGWSQIKIPSKQVAQKARSFYHGEIVGGVLKDKTDLLFVSPNFK